MELKYLKDSLADNTLTEDFFIFHISDKDDGSNLLAKQYYKEISK